MATKQKILIVDDDNNIAELVALYLTKECFETKIVNDGEEALKQFHIFHPDLILLDLMLPGIDGYQVCREIRAHSQTPIIMLSAKGEVFDKVLGLELGADDYISKPFRPDELVARVKSQLRRYMQFGGMNAAESNKEQIVNGGLILDMKGKRMLVDGEPVKLTATEYKIVSLLMNNLGRVFSADEIYERVWNEEAYATENTVMVHIRRIREKIEIDAKNPRYLKVVWGIGYKIEKMD